MSLLGWFVIGISIVAGSFLSGVFGMAGGMVVIGVLLIYFDVATAMILLLASCASRQPAPVEDRTQRPPPVVAAPPAETPPAEVAAQPAPPTYTVKRGDTLRQIAAERGIDYRELAAWNNIDNINVLRVGQVLRITSPSEPASSAAGVQTAPLRTESPVGVPQAPVPPVAIAPQAAAPAIIAVPPPAARRRRRP